MNNYWISLILVSMTTAIVYSDPINGNTNATNLEFVGQEDKSVKRLTRAAIPGNVRINGDIKNQVVYNIDGTMTTCKYRSDSKDIQEGYDEDYPPSSDETNCHQLCFTKNKLENQNEIVKVDKFINDSVISEEKSTLIPNTHKTAEIPETSIPTEIRPTDPKAPIEIPKTGITTKTPEFVSTKTPEQVIKPTKVTPRTDEPLSHTSNIGIPNTMRPSTPNPIITIKLPEFISTKTPEKGIKPTEVPPRTDIPLSHTSNIGIPINTTRPSIPNPTITTTIPEFISTKTAEKDIETTKVPPRSDGTQPHTTENGITNPIIPTTLPEFTTTKTPEKVIDPTEVTPRGDETDFLKPHTIRPKRPLKPSRLISRKKLKHKKTKQHGGRRLRRTRINKSRTRIEIPLKNTDPKIPNHSKTNEFQFHSAYYPSFAKGKFS